MNPEWSGLAPAVDAHLAHWGKAERASHWFHRLNGVGATEEQVLQIMQIPWLRRWLTFSFSYGLPDPDGKPQIVVSTSDEWDDKVERFAISNLADSHSVGSQNNQPVVIDGATIAGQEQFSGDAAAFGQGLNLAAREYTMLTKATSHYVSAEVCAEISDAAGSARNEPLYETDVFCPAGFAVFEQAIEMPDLDPMTGQPADDLWVHIRAIGWHVHDGIANFKSGRIGKGVSIFLYSTKEDYRDGYQRYLEMSGRKVPYDWTEVDDGFLPIDVLPWQFGLDWDQRAEVGYVPGTVPAPIAYERRWFYSFMRLMWQRIIIPQRGDVKRHERRRFEHDAKRKELLEYTVLRLRRLTEAVPSDQHTGTGRMLDHRVLARGYWMYAHVKSLGPARDAHGQQIPETHRWTWVEPAWRGPEDGPYGAMMHATSVIR